MVHSAIYAYIGICIPDFSNISDWKMSLKSLEGGKGMLILILLTIISMTKLLCFLYAFFIHQKVVEDKNGNNAGECDYSEDGKTSVSLTLTVGSGLVELKKEMASSAVLDRSIDDSLSINSFNNRSCGGLNYKGGISNVSTADESISKFEKEYGSQNMIRNFLKKP